MSLEKKQLDSEAERLRLLLRVKRQEVEALAQEWIVANRKARDWTSGERCQARSYVDGWLCCLSNDHEDEHETPGGYKFYRTR